QKYLEFYSEIHLKYSDRKHHFYKHNFQKTGVFQISTDRYLAEIAPIPDKANSHFLNLYLKEYQIVSKEIHLYFQKFYFQCQRKRIYCHRSDLNGWCKLKYIFSEENHIDFSLPHFQVFQNLKGVRNPLNFYFLARLFPLGLFLCTCLFHV